MYDDSMAEKDAREWDKMVEEWIAQSSEFHIPIKVHGDPYMAGYRFYDRAIYLGKKSLDNYYMSFIRILNHEYMHAILDEEVGRDECGAWDSKVASKMEDAYHESPWKYEDGVDQIDWGQVIFEREAT
jgi:hypothetical protein